MSWSDLPGLFVTGTDTGVGKTFIAAGIVRSLRGEGLNVAVVKPVATGAVRRGDELRSDDAAVLMAAAGAEVAPERVAPLVFERPLAPPVAARWAGRPLTLASVLAATTGALDRWAEQGSQVAVVEGVGGLLCPLAEDATVADLAVRLDYPLVIVARRRLGTLNQAIMTVEAARLRGLRIAGIVLNAAEPLGDDDESDSTNAGELLRRFEGVPILAVVPHGAGGSALLFENKCLNWNDRAAPTRFVGSAGAPESRSGERG